MLGLLRKVLGFHNGSNRLSFESIFLTWIQLSSNQLLKPLFNCPSPQWATQMFEIVHILDHARKWEILFLRDLSPTPQSFHLSCQAASPIESPHLGEHNTYEDLWGLQARWYPLTPSHTASHTVYWFVQMFWELLVSLFSSSAFLPLLLLICQSSSPISAFSFFKQQSLEGT